MKDKDDLKVEVKMHFEQIIDLCDLILETGEYKLPTILTIRGLAESGLNSAKLI